MPTTTKKKVIRTDAQLANLTIQHRCGAKKGDGEPCTANGSIKDPEGWRCPHHSSRYTDAERREWSQRGGLTTAHGRTVEKIKALEVKAGLLDLPDLSDSKAVTALLARTYAEVRAGLVPPAQGRVLKEIIDSRVKLAELEKLADLQAQLDDEEN